MTRSFARLRGLRRATAVIVSVAMLMSLVVLPAFAAPATPSQADPTSLLPGSTGITNVQGQGSLGLLGSYQMRILGTGPTAGNVQGANSWSGSERNTTLGTLDVPSPQANTSVILRLWLQGPGGWPAPKNTPLLVTGLTTASTVADVVKQINDLYGRWVTAYFDGGGFVRIDTDYHGAGASVAVYDNYAPVDTTSRGIADAIFAAEASPYVNWAITDGVEVGSDYSVGFGPEGGVATFTPNPDDAVPANNFTPYGVGATLGFIDDTGFHAGAMDPITGFFTAVQLEQGHDFQLTAGAPATTGSPGISPGVVKFATIDGVRDNVYGDIGYQQGNLLIGGDRQAGHVETVTITVPAAVSSDPTVHADGLQDSINGIKFKLPAGFEPITDIFGKPIVDMQPSWSAPNLGVTWDAATHTYFFNGFQETAPDTFTFAIKVRNTTVSSWAMFGDSGEDYQGIVSIRNVAGTMFAPLLSQPVFLHVNSDNLVKSITATVDGNRAGGFDKIKGHLWDMYGNEIVEWPHQVNFKFTENPGFAPDMGSQISVDSMNSWSQIGAFLPASPISTFPAMNSPFAADLKYSSTEGTTSLDVWTVNAPSDGVTTTVSFNTAGIGAPKALKTILLEKDGSLSNRFSRPATDTPYFKLQLVDANGMPTSFTSGGTHNFDWLGDESPGFHFWRQDIPIDENYSTSDMFSNHNPDYWHQGPQAVWNLSANDDQGFVLPAPLTTINFGATPGVATHFLITATKPIPGNHASRDNLFNDMRHNQQAFGYASGSDTSTEVVTLKGQLVDDWNRPVALAGVNVNFAVQQLRPGMLNHDSAVTDANGAVTVDVSSKAGSERYLNSDFNEKTYFSEITFQSDLFANRTPDAGWAYFVRGRLVDLEAAKHHVKADGVDKTAVTATVEDQAFDMPVANWPITFETDFGMLTPAIGTLMTGSDGTAAVDISSAAKGEAHVKAHDQDGNIKIEEVNFDNYYLVVHALSPAVQAGDDATATFEVTVKDLNNNNVAFNDYDRHGLDADVLNAAGKWVNNPVSSTLDNSTGTSRILVTVPAWAMNHPQDLSEGLRTLKVEKLEVAQKTGVFTQDYDVYGPESADVNFVNSATFASKVILPKDGSIASNVLETVYARLEYLSGGGFTQPMGDEIQRDTAISLVGPDGLRGEKVGVLGPVVRKDGSILPQTQPWANVGALLPGTYDVIVDGMKFTGALTVLPWAKQDVTVNLFAKNTKPGEPTELYGNVYAAGFPSNGRAGAVVYLQQLRERQLGQR